MRPSYLALLGGAFLLMGWAVYASTRLATSCPSPSPLSVESLFAPCLQTQAYVRQNVAVQ